MGFGRDIAEASPFALTRGFENAGRASGYLFRPEAMARGGYEADPAQRALTTGDALGIILEAQRDCLAQMHRA